MLTCIWIKHYDTKKIAAYIGAATWLPQIATWIYRRLVQPIVTIVPDNYATRKLVLHLTDQYLRKVGHDLKNKNNLIRDECPSVASGKGGDPKNNGMSKIGI